MGDQEEVMLKHAAEPPAVEPSSAVRLGAPPVTNDHGAYAMLLLPMLIGFILGAWRGPAAGTNLPLVLLLFAGAILALFLASEPLGTLARPRANAAARGRALRWLGIYLSVAVLAGVSLLAIWGRGGLLAFLAVPGVLMLLFLVAVRGRKQRTLGVRLPAIVGLTLSGPAAYYAVSGRLDAVAWGLWAACAVYFTGTIFNVRAWFEATRQLKGGAAQPHLPAWLVAAILLYLLVGGLVFAGCAWAGALPWAALLAFVPSVLRAGWTLWRVPVHLPIRRVGLLELGQSSLFTLLLLATVTLS
jgi:hypothetical protein